MISIEIYLVCTNFALIYHEYNSVKVNVIQTTNNKINTITHHTLVQF